MYDREKGTPGPVIPYIETDIMARVDELVLGLGSGLRSSMRVMSISYSVFLFHYLRRSSGRSASIFGLKPSMYQSEVELVSSAD